MSPLTDEAPLRLDRPQLVQGVREVLDRTGFTETGIAQQCGVGEMSKLGFGPLDRPRLLWRTRDESPLSTLIRLFLIGMPVDLATLRRAVAPGDPADWAELGLVSVEGTKARAEVALRWAEGLVIAHDRPFADGGKRHDHVLGVTGTTQSLSRVTVRLASRRTLDLGTGCGFLALKAAAHSRHVLATDLNRRAVAMTRFNAQLNGIAHVEAAAGDLFDPAGDDPFDLIVSNPPFVISPESQFQFRDSGLAGDAICERIVRAAPEHLAEGGYFQMLCNWARIRGMDWRGRLLGWFADSGCDVQVIHTETFPIDVYANHWLRQTELTDQDRFGEAFDRWIAYYEGLGIEAIDNGLITLRRRAGGSNWIRVEMDRRENHPNGTAILASFAAQDLLGRIGGDSREWLDLKLRCRPQLRMVQKLKPGESGWLVDDARCMLGDGLEFEGPVDQTAFHLLTLCRGHLPLSAVLARVATLTGEHLDERLPAWLETVKALIQQGFLLSAEQPSSAEQWAVSPGGGPA